MAGTPGAPPELGAFRHAPGQTRRVLNDSYHTHHTGISSFVFGDVGVGSVCLFSLVPVCTFKTPPVCTVIKPMFFGHGRFLQYTRERFQHSHWANTRTLNAHKHGRREEIIKHTHEKCAMCFPSPLFVKIIADFHVRAIIFVMFSFARVTVKIILVRMRVPLSVQKRTSSGKSPSCGTPQTYPTTSALDHGSMR